MENEKELIDLKSEIDDFISNQNEPRYMIGYIIADILCDSVVSDDPEFIRGLHDRIFEEVSEL